MDATPPSADRAEAAPGRRSVFRTAKPRHELPKLDECIVEAPTRSLVHIPQGVVHTPGRRFGLEVVRPPPTTER